MIPSILCYLPPSVELLQLKTPQFSNSDPRHPVFNQIETSAVRNSIDEFVNLCVFLSVLLYVLLSLHISVHLYVHLHVPLSDRLSPCLVTQTMHHMSFF